MMPEAAIRTHEAFIGLGSNLGEREAYLCNALQVLNKIPQTSVSAYSSIYESASLASDDQPNYLNAVVKLSTSLSPWDLLRAVQAIENQCGRERTGHWAPRTLDLDILLFADQTIENQQLSIPHPGIYMRNFVLMPLIEIAPDLCFPDQTTIETRASECPHLPICKLVVDEFQLPTNR